MRGVYACWHMHNIENRACQLQDMHWNYACTYTQLNTKNHGLLQHTWLTISSAREMSHRAVNGPGRVAATFHTCLVKLLSTSPISDSTLSWPKPDFLGDPRTRQLPNSAALPHSEASCCLHTSKPRKLPRIPLFATKTEPLWKLLC